jgi:ferric-dicitrate binding protein FerR (iron transport regulator)
VFVGRGAIEVLGTGFDVYQHRNGDEEVSVLEGRVRIRGLATASSKPWYLDLNAGQQATWGDGAPIVHQLDASKVTAWREARLEFENRPLPEVIEELQRYTPIPIRIADPRLLTIHVTGELEVDPLHIRGSILRLAERPEIEVHDNGRFLTLTYRAQDLQTSPRLPQSRTEAPGPTREQATTGK